MLGSAGQVIQVPDLKKSRIFLSGLAISAVDANGNFVALISAVKPENALALADSMAVPAIRRFRPNTIIGYAYTLYNVQINKTANQPQLTVQINLYRDGKLISEGKPKLLSTGKYTMPLNKYGYLRLNANTDKGDYALQVIIKDLQVNETASQWVDFEVAQ